ncbi:MULTISPECIES: glycosyltransferase family 2 protein [Citrobacter]|uniref:glycosyltransferase family 2 protein n=1 Tax=Citrobacter TaxID=544 RepID=UPI001039DC72|nr:MULTISPECIES: glycosyltransferase family 2 protein [Citrobacter]MBJ9261994.1 glycosyltransferase family 2 protein [Citrobacter braakii]MBN4810368.1 glycosyltransferase family 2 protein [Citrobacter braakii]MBN4815366.1 glycosyltransferase family 2 protein [Citrobacter braakii]MBN4824866.1 glycosyltransferase family 2 protein [Citrobacter braakii]MBN4839419.1 glycosyltransferase family 2 protein [Citrobacter braakii]
MINDNMIDIVIVSHGNYEDLVNIFNELSGCEQCNIWVRDNLSEYKVRELCSQYSINYSPALRCEGFALNNNIIVEEIIRKYNALCTNNESHYVLFMNPDAFITKTALTLLNEKVLQNQPDMFTIDLYKDKSFTVRDPAIRRFPTVATFLCSFLMNKNNSILDRNSLIETSNPDWCASSFFGIKLNHYIDLNGFDSRFFMYCEDVDLCYRAKQRGLNLTYYPDICGIHRANHGSKKIFSQNFLWHFSSAIRYIWYRINEHR